MTALILLKLFQGLTLDLGFGLNVNLEKMSFYLEGGYYLPWNDVFATEKPDKVDGGVGANIGVTFPLTD